jgi:hypothetical protein
MFLSVLLWAILASSLRRSKWSGIETAADEKCARRVRLSMTRSGPRVDFQVALQQTAGPLLDDLVGKREQLVGNLETERLSSLEVDDKLELRRLHHWQIGRLNTLENPSGVDSDLPI